jgi:prepilin-type N-terminal cleavage/methylation domain-containing protein
MADMSRRHRAFTIVEMLVVMTVIVITVSALTLPGIWAAYDQAEALVNGAQGTGITGEYYSGSSQNGGIFNTMIVTRTDEQINMGESDRPIGVPADHYSVRWVGMFRAEETGSYKFYPRTDDGVDLFLNGQKVVSDIANGHGMQEFTATLEIDAGQLITFQMDFQEFTGGSGAEMRFSGPNVNKQFIPADNFFPIGSSAEVSITGYEHTLNAAIDKSKHVRYHR